MGTNLVNSLGEPLFVAAIQYPVPLITSPDDIQVNVDKICRAVDNTKIKYPGLDLIVFPEYSTQGLNTKIWLYDEMLLTMDGAEVAKYKSACKRNQVWGVFSIMEADLESDALYNSAIIINDKGEIVLHYRKLLPWALIEPWAPGNYGMPVCDGPKGSKLAVCICHDGTSSELAREAAHKGCNVYIRISGYSSLENADWVKTNKINAWQNLMYTVSVNLAGSDDVFYYFGECTICNYDGNVIQQGQSDPWEVITAKLFPKALNNVRNNWISDLNERFNRIKLPLCFV